MIAQYSEVGNASHICFVSKIEIKNYLAQKNLVFILFCKIGEEGLAAMCVRTGRYVVGEEESHVRIWK